MLNIFLYQLTTFNNLVLLSIIIIKNAKFKIVLLIIY